MQYLVVPNDALPYSTSEIGERGSPSVTVRQILPERASAKPCSVYGFYSRHGILRAVVRDIGTHTRTSRRVDVVEIVLVHHHLLDLSVQPEILGLTKYLQTHTQGEHHRR